MFLDPALRVIQQLVERADMSEAEELAAKAQLLDYLAAHPDSADAWYLVSQLSDNREDAILALERCLRLNPAHYEGRRAYDQLKPTTADATSQPAPKSPRIEAAGDPEFDFLDEPTPDVAHVDETGDPEFDFMDEPETISPVAKPHKPTPQPKTTKPRAGSKRSTSEPELQVPSDQLLGPIQGKAINSTLLNATAFRYVQDGWNVVDIKPRSVRLEKTFGLAWIWALLATVLIPGLGFVVLVGNLFARRTKKVTLETIPSGDRISISGVGKDKVWLTPEHIQRGQIPMPHVNFWESMVWGLVLTVVLCVGLVAFVFIAGSEITEDETFSPGQTVIIQSRSNTTCAPLFDTPSRFSERGVSLPSGIEVTILGVQQSGDDDPTWYQVRTDNGLMGWLSEDYVDDQPASLNGSFEACN